MHRISISELELTGLEPFICPRCIESDELKAFIRANATSDTCSFCHRTSKSKTIAMEAAAVVSLIERYLCAEYEDAAEHVPYESREGGYQARTMTTDELLTDELGLESDNEEAWEYIVGELPDYAWVEQDIFRLSPFDELSYGWKGFAEAVKHQTRYLFFPPRNPDDDWNEEGIRPEDMLGELGRVLRRARAVRTLPAGSIVYRVRLHKAEKTLNSFEELGPPPAEAALYANRMSPAGISMLYAAEDVTTALAETMYGFREHTHAAIATLRLVEDIQIVDLVRLPRIRLFTVEQTRRERAQRLFAHAFAREVSKRVSRDGHEHIEYVPTQVVTEYLRFRFRHRRQPVRGLRFRSSQNEGGTNVALFFGRDDVLPQQWRDVKSPIELVEVTRREL